MIMRKSKTWPTNHRATSTMRCDGVARRDLLRIGGLTALGLGVGDLLRCQRTASAENQRTEAESKARSCVLIWLDGGASHLETFDVKPDAPKEVRGPLDSITSSMAGMRISECLPRTATMLDKLAIIRSMTSPLGEHNFGTHYLMTGYKPTPVLEYPTFGSVFAHSRHEKPVLPPHIAVPDFRVGGGRLNGGGYLPAEVRPFSVGGDPAKADFQVRDLDFYRGIDITRLDRRRQFVNALNEFSNGLDRSPSANVDPDLERAYRLITSAEAKTAFDLSEESRETRQRYGGKSIGQSCLLARRLIERGVPFVTVNNRGWDTHDNLYTRLKEGYTGAKVGVGLIPSLDLALSALIEDLDDRGMLDETLIVVMGEFGRTPKLNIAGGRDHWPRVFSTVLAGGGVPGGQVIGSSDSVGESPKDRPITPSDLAATIYTLLGIDPQLELHTSDGRPVRVAPFEAEVVTELVG
jgi:hypothetical protein